MNIYLFNTANLFESATDLFRQLNIKLNSNTTTAIPVRDLLKQHFRNTEIFQAIEKTFYIGTLDDTVLTATGMFDETYSYKQAQAQADKSYEGLMLFALELSKHPTRTEISELTRAFNRISQKMPVALVLKYTVENEAVISIAISERFKYVQTWRQGEKAGKVIILRDIHTQPQNTHTGHLRILQDLVKPVAVTNYAQLHQHWLQVLDVSILNKKFFQELANWYFWAMDNVQFPDDIEKKKDIRNATNLIRLITRVIFIWFIKEKKLVPNNLFRKEYLDKILNDFAKNKKSENYYHAILQNLFFGTLNQKMNERKFAESHKGFVKTDQSVRNIYRFPEKFTISEPEIKKLFADIPFLNGGLFDCLDKTDDETKKEIFVDGFTRDTKHQARVPDYLFFGEKQPVDLTEYYDPNAKKPIVKEVMGLIEILSSYKFTVAENTPIEEEIALDPELLGKVFENLLASYNPETQTTARKQTGSFYTPREIVNYMVDESLMEYLKQNTSTLPDFENRLRDLFSYSENPNPFNEKETKILIEAINNCKILDPACGSGAFPMGVLHKMVHILTKLDGGNKLWKELQRQKAIDETEFAYQIDEKGDRKKRLDEIDDVFENNASDYGRKLYLIENCIYGIDIQPIAVQIAKLRFFISLVIDQNKQEKKENFGIRSLPNLETKFVAANTLISLDIPTNDLFAENNPIKKLENDLKNIRHEYFAASNRKEKLRLQKEDKNLRKKISELIKDQLIKKGDSEIVELKQIIEVEKGKLKQLEKSKEDIEIIKTTDIFGEITQTKIDKKAIKIKTQKDRINHFEKELHIKEQATNKDAIAKVAEQIASFDPYDQNIFANWFDPEWMFGLTDGFDIVIGNPPYKEISERDEKLFFQKNYKEVLSGHYDLFIFFFKKGIDLLKIGGINTFITPHTFIIYSQFENLRKWLYEYHIIEVSDRIESIFESAVVDNSISIIAKSNSILDTKFTKYSYSNGDLQLQSELKLKKSDYTSDAFEINTIQNKVILKKYEVDSLPLGESVQSSQGITVYAKVQGEKINYFRERKESKNSKPYTKGREIFKYTLEWSNSYIEYGDWLWCPRDKKYFESPKIFLRQTSADIIATYIEKPFYCIDSVHSLIKMENGPELKYVLAILNSKLGNYLYNLLIAEQGKVFAQVKLTFLRKIPIKISDSKQQKPFITIVDKILSLKEENSETDTSKLEKQIDEMVYKLYELTEEEIKVIEGGK